MAVRFAILILGVIGLMISKPARASDPTPIFESDIRPLFAEKCGKCHGESVRKGDLDLSSMGGIARGGESGEPLIGEAIDDSLLWTLIDGGEMPPEDEPPLSEEQRELIHRWIVHGGRAEQSHVPVEQKLDQHDVLPILLLRCTACHGPQRQDGNLDLRTRAAMLTGGVSGPAMVPGDPDASLMIQRIESEACPPRRLLLKFFVRRPGMSEVEVLRTWIAEGATEIDDRPDIATTEPDLLVTDEDRKHWAFQPLRATRCATSIDDFVREKLSENGLNFSPEADRDTLIRRAHFDLLGMPPSVEEWQRWNQSDDPLWFQQMIEHLLASPHYGERWGRYWLDLAGYADSEGGISADPMRPVAWKYRDYVIRAFNDDKPYDRFLLEQLAGDELVDCENADTITEEMVDNLIATGFLRMGIDETGSRTMNFVPERLKVISDAITVVSSGLMGLTMECARCHTHKYDPIPHRDYYRFKAIFQGALDEHDWKSFSTRRLTIATDEHRGREKITNPPLEAELKKLLSQQTQIESDIQLQLLRHHYPAQSEDDNKATLVALKRADNNRTLPQKILVEQLRKAELLEDVLQPESVLSGRREVERIQMEMDRIRRQMVPSLMIRALWDDGRPSPTYILRRGEHDQPSELVGPGVPSVLTDGRTLFEVVPPFPGGTNKTGRRLAFARWLTQPDHPLTARVMVNRIWYHHFGAGLVKDLENFGVKGGRPSHPDLLDWLAVEFARRGWSIKEMHRLIMNSRTYRQSSRVTTEHQELDPQNRLLSRMPLRRLDAEAIRDSLLFVSGRLDESRGGLPDAVSVNRDGMVSVYPTQGGDWRRSVYLQYRRTEIPTMMDTFDYPQMGPNCVSRNVSTISPQALMLMNNGHVRELASAFAQRVRSEAGDERHDLDRQIELVYRIAISRPPTEEEQRLGVQFMRELETAWRGEDARSVLDTYCHTILNSAAFLYVD